MTEEELRALVQQGEDQRTEFKLAEADAADIARAMVAFANSGGGNVVLGVGDDGALRGLWYAQPPYIPRRFRDPAMTARFLGHIVIYALADLITLVSQMSPFDF